MYFKIQRDSGTPIFEQIKRKIKDMIASGKLKEGDTLPSVRSLAKILKVNVNTVVRAYRELELEGYVEGRWGLGYVVKGSLKKEKWLEEKRRDFQNFVRELLEYGIDIDILRRWLEEIGGDEDDGG